MKRQSGATLSGLVFFLMLLGLAVYSAYRIVPAYMDYWLVGRVLDTLVAQPSLKNGSDESIRAQFAKQLNFNNITLANRSDLLIERPGGGLVLSAAFSVKRPFFGPINLCLEFQAEASSGGQPDH
ncbi:MAG: DUF4845 domain-containing protein [Pseudomonadota bacterium]|nr:DUF4845 domain-containing protein [Pseudomonadota bacterium]